MQDLTQAAGDAMKRFDHMMVRVSRYPGQEERQIKLDYLGWNGWELVSVTEDYLYLKRETLEPQGSEPQRER